LKRIQKCKELNVIKLVGRTLFSPKEVGPTEPASDRALNFQPFFETASI
jgi:hypothetical protein